MNWISTGCQWLTYHEGRLQEVLKSLSIIESSWVTYYAHKRWERLDVQLRVPR